ncbi:hypothetical protein CBL_00706 [Carabus blaptoides fortunei]
MAPLDAITNKGAKRTRPFIQTTSVGPRPECLLATDCILLYSERLRYWIRHRTDDRGPRAETPQSAQMATSIKGLICHGGVTTWKSIRSAFFRRQKSTGENL